jgi:hypothetical protein
VAVGLQGLEEVGAYGIQFGLVVAAVARDQAQLEHDVSSELVLTEESRSSVRFFKSRTKTIPSALRNDWNIVSLV